MSNWASFIHGIDLLLTAVCVGGVTFSAWIAPVSPPDAPTVRSRWGRIHTVFLGALLFLTVAWFALSSHEMTNSWALGDFATVAISSTFGHLWIGKAVLLIALICASWKTRLRYFYLPVLLLPLFFSFNGHAAAQNNFSAFYVSLDYVHFFAVSVWTGGLIALALWLRARLQSQIQDPGMTHRTVRRFSHFAIASTTTIAGSGIALAYLYGVRLGGILKSPYSKLVLVKTILFTATLAVASINQFVHLRKWNPAEEPKFVRGVLRESLLELLLIASVLIVAGFLTRTDMGG